MYNSRPATIDSLYESSSTIQVLYSDIKCVFLTDKNNKVYRSFLAK